MSFAAETKNELSRLEPEKKCCQLAEIAGFLRVSGSIRLAGGGRFKIVTATDNPAVARHYKRLIKEYFNVETALEIGDAQGPKKGHIYMLTIDPDMHSEQILRETGILLVREGNNFISDGIYSTLIRSKCCKKSYLRGVFMGSGTMNDPSRGYHLELVCATQTLAADLRKMINRKSSDNICDTLSIMGAHSQRLLFEEVVLNKGIVNATVRLTNCDNANTDRTLDASSRQIACIRKIEKLRGLDFLPPKLRQAAQLRLEYPEASLIQLGEMMDPPMKKSGINNRFRKIEEIANSL